MAELNNDLRPDTMDLLQSYMQLSFVRSQVRGKAQCRATDDGEIIVAVLNETDPMLLSLSWVSA
jgi:hypothetical protein